MKKRSKKEIKWESEGSVTIIKVTGEHVRGSQTDRGRRGSRW